VQLYQTNKSEQMFKRASRSLAGGVSSFGRSVEIATQTMPAAQPLFVPPLLV